MSNFVQIYIREQISPMRATNFLSQIRSEFWNKFKGNYNSLQFPSNILHCPILLIWHTRTFLSYAWPPPNPLLTQFRKLQPSPLEVGDHLIKSIDPQGFSKHYRTFRLDKKYLAFKLHIFENIKSKDMWYFQFWRALCKRQTFLQIWRARFLRANSPWLRRLSKT